MRGNTEKTTFVCMRTHLPVCQGIELISEQCLLIQYLYFFEILQIYKTVRSAQVLSMENKMLTNFIKINFVSDGKEVKSLF